MPSQMGGHFVRVQRKSYSNAQNRRTAERAELGIGVLPRRSQTMKIATAKQARGCQALW